MKVYVTIGNEFHTSTHAKGFIFVLDGKSEEHIYKSKKVKLVRKEDPILIGSKGRHGLWTSYTFDVPEGTTIKLFTTDDKKSASGFFKVSSSAPLVRVHGAICHGNGAEIEGQLEWLSPSEFEVDPKYIAHFDRDRLTIEELLSDQS